MSKPRPEATSIAGARDMCGVNPALIAALRRCERADHLYSARRERGPRETMKRFAIAYIAITLLIRPTNAATIDAWKQYSSAAGRFSVGFPNKPQTSEDKMNANGIPTTVHTFAADLGARAFIVSYNDYPMKALAGSDPRDLLVGAEKGALNNVQGKLIDDQAFKFGNYHARSYAVKVQGDHVVRANMIMVGNRLYQILVVVPTAEADSADVKKFFGSFELMDK